MSDKDKLIKQLKRSRHETAKLQKKLFEKRLEIGQKDREFKHYAQHEITCKVRDREHGQCSCGLEQVLEGIPPH